MPCAGMTKAGRPCRAGEFTLLPDGYCSAHSPSPEARAKRAAQQQQAAEASVAYTSRHRPFTLAELAALVTLEDAKRGLDQIRMGVLTQRITHAEGNAASKAIGEWVRAHGAQLSEELVTKLRREVATLKAELQTARRAHAVER